MAINAKLVKELRDETGLPMMKCKQALTECKGDKELAKEALRKKGMETAAKKSGREIKEGAVGSYIHFNNRVGVLVEIGCESDFVAKNDQFKEFHKNIAMHIAFAEPMVVSREDISAELVAKEREIYTAQIQESGKKKPAEIVEKIVEGKVDKFYASQCLLDQPFFKDDKKTVAEMIKETIAMLGENLKVIRFSRMEVGK
jgi:elongation factor Ts